MQDETHTLLNDWTIPPWTGCRLGFSRRARRRCEGCPPSPTARPAFQRARARPPPVPRRRPRRRLSRVWSDGPTERERGERFFPPKLSRKRGRTEERRIHLFVAVSSRQSAVALPRRRAGFWRCREKCDSRINYSGGTKYEDMDIGWLSNCRGALKSTSQVVSLRSEDILSSCPHKAR